MDSAARRLMVLGSNAEYRRQAGVVRIKGKTRRATVSQRE
jgi:hypothetical protein